MDKSNFFIKIDKIDLIIECCIQLVIKISTKFSYSIYYIFTKITNSGKNAYKQRV